ncbi:MAG: DUF2971 domain-containing protein [Immundisolibacteraceae bacterium]|nr:DUF2971 domain-containing protein [Immundisolibacteraceae bacterium]
MKFINPLLDDKLYLYHYTPSDTAINYILKDNTIQFSPFSNVNDPRESKNWEISPSVNVDANLKREEYESISREVSAILKCNAKLVCFSQDNSSAKKGAWQPQELFDRGFSKPSMWHHYAGGHDGVCLMFNRKKLISIFEDSLKKQHLFHGAVNYSNEGIIPKLQEDPYFIDLILVNNKNSYFTAIQNHLSLWYKHLFLRKLIDWSNESEYRWVYLDENPDPICLDFGDALEGIMIGEGVTESKREQIIQEGIKRYAEVANLSWKNGYPIVKPNLDSLIKSAC